jgi:hypothetical protein
MISKLFRSPKTNRSSRPAVRPTLETLEGREVPSTVQVQVAAALQELPQAVSNLQQNIAAQDFQNGHANFTIITNDVNLLSQKAPFFASQSRFQIDLTLFNSGVQLYQMGFGLHAQGDNGDANLVGNFGVGAFLAGFQDYLSMTEGQSLGNLNLPSPS